MYRNNWKPSRTKAREFAKTMDEIQEYCDKNHINYSSSMSSYYFEINKQKYRISNHSIETSNRGAYKDGLKVRNIYHDAEREPDVIYIHASKTRLIEIHEKLLKGHRLDGNGFIINK